MERFSDTELIRIFRQGERTETVRDRLFASGRGSPPPSLRLLFVPHPLTLGRGTISP